MRKVILLVVAAMLLVSNATAIMHLNGGTDGDSIWVIVDGDDIQPPVNIWVNGELVAENYPHWEYIYPHDNAEQMSIMVVDSAGQMATIVIKTVLQTFPVYMWGVVGLVIVFMLLSLRFPLASIISFVMSGFFVLQVIPEPVYAPHLKIFAGFLFALGISSLFMVINRNIV